MNFCTSCGTRVLDGAAFCTGCGTRLAPADPEAAAETTSVFAPQTPSDPDPAPPAGQSPAAPDPAATHVWGPDIAATQVRGTDPVVPAQPEGLASRPFLAETIQPSPQYRQPMPQHPPPVPPAPARGTRAPGGSNRTGLILALVLVLLLGGGVGGVLVWKQRQDPDPSPSATSTTQDRTRASEPADASPTPDPVTPSPTTAVQRSSRCPDGSLISAGATCRVDTTAAAIAAFGMARGQCTRSTAGADHAGAVNLSCLNDRVHVAIYQNAQKRRQRLSAYGLGSGGCEYAPGGTMLCGPTRNGRWVRAYNDNTGILYYASVKGEDYPILRDLNQLTAEELLRGTPTS